MRFLLVVLTASVVCSTPLPDHPPSVYGGFQPLHGARGSGPASGYGSSASPAGYSAPAPAPTYAAPSGRDGYGGGGGGAVGPTKTIYVNVPHPDPVAPLPPIAAGPPRKHYKIVFIRAPAPPPPPQPILPPRTEQKTLIYVLHQRPQQQDQQVIEIPAVKHNPEVFFVQYDNPPTAEELQQLSAGDLSGFSLAAQPLSYGAGGGGDLGVISSRDESGEVTFQLTNAGDGVGVPLPGIGSVGGGGGVPLSGIGSVGGGGGVPLPTFGSGGAGVPLPTGGAPFSSGGGVPLPLGSSGGGGGVSLPGLGGLSSSGGSSFRSGGSGGVALPSFGGSGGGGFSSIPRPSATIGGGLQVIGDEIVRPIGNTGFFQEVDDDIAALSGFGNTPLFSLEVDDPFDNRVGAASSPARVTLVSS